jgi:von Willebrand factor type D domain/PQQ-like domain
MTKLKLLYPLLPLVTLVLLTIPEVAHASGFDQPPIKYPDGSVVEYLSSDNADYRQSELLETLNAEIKKCKGFRKSFGSTITATGAGISATATVTAAIGVATGAPSAGLTVVGVTIPSAGVIAIGGGIATVGGVIGGLDAECESAHADDFKSITLLKSKIALCKASNSGVVLTTTGAQNWLRFDWPKFSIRCQKPPKKKKGSGKGDPHLLTQDERRYDVQSRGEFNYLVSTANSTPLLQVRHEYYVLPSTSASVITAVAIQSGLHRIEMRVKKTPNLLVDGQPFDGTYLDLGFETSLTVDRINGLVYSIGVEGNNSSIDVTNMTPLESNAGFRYMSVDASVPSDGSYRGLLGKPNDNADDDFELPSGVQATDAEALARGWRVNTTPDSLFTYDAGESPATYNNASQPGVALTQAELDTARNDLLQALPAGTLPSAKLEELVVDRANGMPLEQVLKDAFTYNVNGKIYSGSSAVSGTELAGTAISVTAPGYPTCQTTSAADGTYRCNFQPSASTLSTLPSFTVSTPNGASVTQTATVAPILGSTNDILIDLSLNLPTLRVSGTVKTTDGTPIPNAGLKVRAIGTLGATDRLLYTDPLGNYSLNFPYSSGTSSASVTVEASTLLSRTLRTVNAPLVSGIVDRTQDFVLPTVQIRTQPTSTAPLATSQYQFLLAKNGTMYSLEPNTHLLSATLSDGSLAWSLDLSADPGLRDVMLSSSQDVLIGYTSSSYGGGYPVRAVNASGTDQGKLRWSFPMSPDQTIQAIKFGKDGTVFLLQRGNAGDTLTALDPSSGAVRWSESSSATAAFYGSRMVVSPVSNKIYIQQSQHPIVKVFEGATGAALPDLAIGRGDYLERLIGVTASSDGLLVINGDGDASPTFGYSAATGQLVDVISYKPYLDFDPLASGTGTGQFYVLSGTSSTNSYSANLQLFNTDGQTLWSRSVCSQATVPLEPILTCPDTMSGTGYLSVTMFGTDKNHNIYLSVFQSIDGTYQVVSLDPSGKTRWVASLVGTSPSGLVDTDGWVYLTSSDALGRNNLLALDPAGLGVWSYQSPTNISLYFLGAELGRVFLNDTNGNLINFQR